MSNDPQYISARLRPEASPIDWSYLNESQKEAFRRVLYMLDEAAAAVSDNSEKRRSWASELIQPHRSKLSAFISGARGSGKTSVMLSLMDAITSDKIIPYDGVRTDMFKNALKKARERIVWLEPIDLEPLPNPFSLVPSILDRVMQAVERARSLKGQAPLRCDAELYDHDLLIQYQQIYREATLAWDSNIRERKSQLDPLAYANEMQATNLARLSLSQRIDHLLAEIGEKCFDPCGIYNPIFVVSIDDFDLHPAASLNILRMLRMLTSPRLFFLMLGDIQILEVMSDLAVSSEINTIIAKDTAIDTLGIQPEQIARLGGSISRNGLRKLLPAEQRFHLANPSMTEGLLYRPPLKLFAEDNSEKAYGLTIAELCYNIPFRVNQTLFKKGESWEICGTVVVTLLDYFFHPGFQSVAKPNAGSLNLLMSEKDKVFPPTNDKIDNDKYTEKLRTFCEGSNNTLSENHRTLEFRKKPLNASDKKQTGTDKCNSKIDLSKVVDAQEIKAFDEKIETQFSWANHLFVTSPRRLADFWFALRRQVTGITRNIERIKRASDNTDDTKEVIAGKLHEMFDRFENLFCEELARMCRDSLLEETAFTPSERERIAAALTPSSIGDFNWSSLPLRLIAVMEPPIVISGDSWAGNRKRVRSGDSFRNLYHEVRVSRVADWTVVAKQDPDATQALSAGVDNIDASRELSQSTSALVMLLHDKLKLGNQSHRFETNLIPNDDGTLNPNIRFLDGNKPNERVRQDNEFWCRWASTQYRGSYHNLRDLYWPAPSAMSVWSLDQFRRSWNSTLEFLREPGENVSAASVEAGETNELSGITPQQRVETLAYGWIDAGCAVIDGKPGNTIDSKPEPTDWENVFIRLNGIAHDYSEKSRGRETEDTRCMKNWLQNVVILMMPEMGLPTHLMFRVLFGLAIDSDKSSKISPTHSLTGMTVDEANKRYALDNRTLCLNYSTRLKKAYDGIKDTLEKDDVWLTHTHHDKRSEEDRKRSFDDKHKRKPPEKNARDACHWLVGYPFVRFMKEHKNEIRARRGVRLALLRHIVNSDLTTHLKRSRALFLADVPVEHADSKDGEQLKLELGDEDWFKRCEHDKCYEDCKECGDITGTPKVFAAKLFTTGYIFSGGGLVPHEDEIPEWTSDDSNLEHDICDDIREIVDSNVDKIADRMEKMNQEAIARGLRKRKPSRKRK